MCQSSPDSMLLLLSLLLLLAWPWCRQSTVYSMSHHGFMTLSQPTHMSCHVPGIERFQFGVILVSSVHSPVRGEVGR